MWSYLLINTKPGSEKRIVRKLLEFEGVINQAHLTEGDFSIVAGVTTDDAQRLKMFLAEHIEKIPEITQTKTLLKAD